MSESEWDLFAMKVCTDKEFALAGRYNKHIGILHLNMWSNYTKDT